MRLPVFLEPDWLEASFHVYMKERAEEKEIESLLGNHGLFFLFTKDGEYFGAGEDSRMTFARMKHPDEDSPKDWADEAKFTAVNLNKLMNGEFCHHMFGKDELKGIEVVEPEEVTRYLNKLRDPKKPLASIVAIMHSDEGHDRKE